MIYLYRVLHIKFQRISKSSKDIILSRRKKRYESKKGYFSRVTLAELKCTLIQIFFRNKLFNQERFSSLAARFRQDIDSVRRNLCGHEDHHTEATGSPLVRRPRQLANLPGKVSKRERTISCLSARNVATESPGGRRATLRAGSGRAGLVAKGNGL